METLGSILHDYRENWGLSKTEAARICGISPQYWWLLENDRRVASSDTIDKIAAGTGYSVSRLLMGAHNVRHKELVI